MTIERGGEIAQTEFMCAECGYDLSGAAVGGLCPECGTPVQDSLRRRDPLATCPAATSATILGICSLVICGVLGPFAIAQYFSAMKQIRAGRYAPASATMAKAGLITGIISTVLTAGAVAMFAAGVDF